MFGESPPQVTFLHGAGLNAHTFDPVILGLNMPALSIDLPGHGLSQWRDDADYRPATNAVVLAEVIAALTNQPQTLIGHSLGGLSAVRLAAEHPEQVRHLVLLDITPGVTADDGGSTIREFIAGQRRFDTIEEIIDRAIAFNIGHDREALRRGITLNTRLRDDGTFEWTHHLAHLLTSEEESLSATPLSTGNQSSYADLWADAQRITELGIPITLVRGDSGMISEALAEEWRVNVSGSQVLTLRGGHNVQEHNPQELSRLIANIVSS